MPTLYLHIGRGKTGTTQIQRYLAQCQTELAEQGVWYVLADGGRGGDGHQNLAKSFVTSSPEFMIRSARPDEVRQQVLDEITSTRPETAIISSENFAIADVSAVKDYLTLLPDDYTVKIVYFARSQDEVAESEYNQIVKMKLETRPLLDYIRNEIEGIDYMQVAGEWEGYFGHENMICRVYNSKSDIMGQFLSCIPEVRAELLPDFTPSDTNSAANMSIGIRALTIARLLNGVEIEKRDALYNDLFSRLAGNDLPPLLLSSEAASEIRVPYAQSNREFTGRYLGHQMADLGGRRYSDAERDNIRREIERLGLEIP